MSGAERIAAAERQAGSLAAELAGTPWRRLVLSERHGIWCLVDAAHYEWLTQWRWNWGWHAKSVDRYYAKRNVGSARSTLYLHRELLLQVDPRDADFHASHHVDHINGNSLDNRIENLRWLTPRENTANRIPRSQIPSLEKIVARLLASLPGQDEDMPF